jgi:hypothetical protein
MRGLSIAHLHDFNRTPVKCPAAFMENSFAVVVYQRKGDPWMMDSSILPSPDEMGAMGSVLGGGHPS